MALLKCFSSQLMTPLLAWRNPQGSEEGWLWRGQGISNCWEHFGKVVTAEVGLSILTTTALAETVAYAALSMTSLILFPVTDRPYKFFAKLLESSSFTIIWGAADALFYNPFVINVMSQESFARFWAQYFNPTSIKLFRLEDKLYVADWARQNNRLNQVVNDFMLGPIFNIAEIINKLIEEGANFILRDVLSGVSNQTQEDFKNMNPSSNIYSFVLTKAIFIYAVGFKKDHEIPDFFKLETKNAITALREEIVDQEVIKQIERTMTNSEQFELELSNVAAKAIFNRLRILASEEAQGGFFATRCWEKASQLLESRNA